MSYLERTSEASASDEYVSVSRINSFRMCPRKYYYGYIAKAPKEHVPAAMVFGSAAHRVIEEVYRLRQAGQEMSANDVEDAAATAFAERIEEAHDEADTVLFPQKTITHAGAMKDRLIGVMRHWVDYASMPDKVLAVETRFRGVITDPKHCRQTPTWLHTPRPNRCVSIS